MNFFFFNFALRISFYFIRMKATITLLFVFFFSIIDWSYKRIRKIIEKRHRFPSPACRKAPPLLHCKIRCPFQQPALGLSVSDAVLLLVFCLLFSCFPYPRWTIRACFEDSDAWQLAPAWYQTSRTLWPYLTLRPSLARSLEHCHVLYLLLFLFLLSGLGLYSILGSSLALTLTNASLSQSSIDACFHSSLLEPLIPSIIQADNFE